MKRKYMTEQGGNNDEEGTTESKQKHSQWHKTKHKRNAKHTKINGKKKRGRQCLPMARKQCKEERKKRGST